MARWYEGAEEAAFKPVAGGYVFQCPNPWVVGRSRNYLVNEAQKAALAACLRRQRRQVLLLALVYMLIAAGLGTVAAQGGQRLSPASFVAVAAVTFLAVLSVALVPQIYLMRAMRPLLAELQPTDERITIREKFHGLAAAISGKLLLIGALAGAFTIIGNIVSLSQAISADRTGSDLYWPVLALAFGVLLIGYFGYLGILKARLKRNAS